jgi:sister-chromatid-cohesion protein PDS5
MIADMNSKQLLEHYFVEFAHMLAHHPDFSMESEDLETFQVYLKFYLETIATSENISFLYYSSAQLKMVQDKFSTDSKILYVVSEMAQVLIREHCAHNNWILQTYPGKVGITKELFTKLGAQEAVDNVKLIYLEESDFMKHRMKKPLKRTKAKIQEEEDEEDSDSTQVDDTPKKSPKLKSNVSTNVSTPIRRSERSKKVRSIA